ncbi:MAG: hypothetical protein PHO32_02390 [Candidatus Cloacimonetes bacterium]|nr:hypothetical protein [Candidatus Cloacimonadota bacterium]
MLEKPVESVALHILQELDYSTHSYPRLLAEDCEIELIRLDILWDKLRLLNPLLSDECITEVTCSATYICKNSYTLNVTEGLSKRF